MSGAMNFGSFLDGAVSGLETGMDLREKYDIYKKRRTDRKDEEAARKATGDSVKAAEAAAVAPPPVPTTGSYTARMPMAAQHGAGVFSRQSYNSDIPLAPVAALRRGVGMNGSPGRYDLPTRRLR